MLLGSAMPMTLRSCGSRGMSFDAPLHMDHTKPRRLDPSHGKSWPAVLLSTMRRSMSTTFVLHRNKDSQVALSLALTRVVRFLRCRCCVRVLLSVLFSFGGFKFGHSRTIRLRCSRLLPTRP